MILRKIIQRFKPQLKKVCSVHPNMMKWCQQVKYQLVQLYQLLKRPLMVTASGTLPPEKLDGVSWSRSVLTSQADDYQTEVPLPVASVSSSGRAHRVFAFYLPQFHSFAENDHWWGKGFTEWTNTTKAYPQFVGHEQPRLPADLGFYDLSHTKVMYQQAELAKQYGVDGFCVYYYWFAGQSLMETPLQNWYQDKALNFPLFLCWANENWTRRWDGQEQHVLKAQQHSPEDDIAFISHIAGYLMDSRYIRVDGKPLLLLYYPSLLPDAGATAQRWREYMRTNHHTELHLLCVQSRDKVDPRNIGFDGAVEFPPVGSHAVAFQEKLDILAQDFAGFVYDYAETVNMRLAKDESAPYFVARGVMPGWDNTPRRLGKANIFVNYHPADYGRWLHDAILSMRWKYADKPSQQIVFVNAWNEWAEGAYLEPDRRHGHAYLKETHKAVSLWNQDCCRLLHAGGQEYKKAVIIHAFYPDVLPEVAKYLTQAGLSLDVWVSIADEHAMHQVLALWPKARVYLTANLGRDIAPFLSLYPHMLSYNYDAVLKLHTKKSLHRGDGNQWRNFLYQQLLPASSLLEQMFAAWEKHPHIGLLVPDGHAPAIQYFWGQNKNWLQRVTTRLGISMVQGSEVFTAGSMFWFRPAALNRLALSPIVCGDFYYDRAGQIDGTLAHAMERMFAVLAAAEGFSVAQVSEMLGEKVAYDKANWSPFLGTGG